jgi:hypothetical protein
MLDEDAKKKHETTGIQLSNNVVHCNQYLAADMEHELVSRRQSCDGFSFQIDESTGISEVAVLSCVLFFSAIGITLWKICFAINLLKIIQLVKEFLMSLVPT